MSATGDLVPPTLLARKWGTGISCLLSTFWCWAMGTSRWVAQRKKGTMLESHSIQPCPGHQGSFVCFWSQISDRFKWSPRFRSIRDDVGSWTTGASCRLVTLWPGCDPCQPGKLRHQHPCQPGTLRHPPRHLSSGHKTTMVFQG